MPDTQIEPMVLFPTYILAHPGLSNASKWLFAILQAFDHPDAEGHRTGIITPSLAEIADQAQKSTRSVARQLAQLEKVGAIRCERHAGATTTRYLIGTAPDDWAG